MVYPKWTVQASPEHRKAEFTIKTRFSKTTYTITADDRGYGLSVSIAVWNDIGVPQETQLGFACEDRVTAHIDAL